MEPTACPYLNTKGVGLICTAADMPYVPSTLEIQEFCKSSDYMQCPYYLEGISRKYGH